MSVKNTSAPIYVPGRTQQETERLQQQARLFEPFTRRMLEAAGITAGMKVLDVGSGAGDVAFLAADIVGPGGMVVGIDNNPVVLETARQRACASGLSNVSFVDGDMKNVALDTDFDAVVGRHILLYAGNQAMALRALAHHLRPGGIVAFQEFDFSLSESLYSNEAIPLIVRQGLLWIIEAFRRAGNPLQMSLALPEAFRQADLPLPQMALDGVVGLGADWNGYDYLAECLRSVLPLLVRFGIATAEEVGVDTYAARVRAEVVSQHSYIVSPLMVRAWTRKD
ncbi:MAG TPA: class I SAM-dependent methyltransferase [Ktedonobacteraceae bacterium]